MHFLPFYANKALSAPGNHGLLDTYHCPGNPVAHWIVARLLFPDAEIPENVAQDLVGGHLAGDLGQVVEGLPAFLARDMIPLHFPYHRVRPPVGEGAGKVMAPGESPETPLGCIIAE